MFVRNDNDLVNACADGRESNISFLDWNSAVLSGFYHSSCLQLGVGKDEQSRTSCLLKPPEVVPLKVLKKHNPLCIYTFLFVLSLDL